MGDGVRDLYIELLRMFNNIPNKAGAIILAGLFVSILIVLNLYAVIYLLQKLLNLDLTGFLLATRIIPIGLFLLLLAINIGISFYVARQVKGNIEEIFFKARLGRYLALTCLSCCAAVLVFFLSSP